MNIGNMAAGSLASADTFFALKLSWMSDGVISDGWSRDLKGALKVGVASSHGNLLLVGAGLIDLGIVVASEFNRAASVPLDGGWSPLPTA